MLRIALILVIVAGLAALAVTQLVVKEKITGLTTDLAASEERANSAETAKTAAESESKKAREAEQTLTQNLADLNTKFDTLKRNHDAQFKRANDFERERDKVTVERNEAQQELAAWKTIGIPVEQARAQRAELVRTREEREVLAEEKVVLLRNNALLKSDLDRYTGKSREVVLPAGLKGKVLAVDPKFDFVVLNIGRKDGLLENGKMMINREGRLVGKVQIARVDESRSIANILPEWKQVDVLEGDDVLY